MSFKIENTHKNIITLYDFLKSKYDGELSLSFKVEILIDGIVHENLEFVHNGDNNYKVNKLDYWRDNYIPFIDSILFYRNNTHFLTMFFHFNDEWQFSQFRNNTLTDSGKEVIRESELISHFRKSKITELLK